MRKKTECIKCTIIIFLIWSFANCLVASDYAFADQKFQPHVQGISYLQADNSFTPGTFADMLEAFVTFREDLMNVIDYFNPSRASLMEEKNELIRDILEIINDLPRNSR